MARAIETAIPIASAAEVGEWVEALARESLLERARKTARIESGSSVPIEERAERLALAAGDASGVATFDGELGDEERPSGPPGPARPRSWRPLVFAFAAVAIAAPTIALLSHRGLARGSAPLAPTVADTTPSVREPITPPSAPPVTLSPPEIAATTVPSQVPVPARRVVVDLPPKSPSPPPSARLRPVRPAPAKPSCDPPWTLEDGVKKYKLECL
jgi:eukaryotic-like serine/threonine-protein kinase